MLRFHWISTLNEYLSQSEINWITFRYILEKNFLSINKFLTIEDKLEFNFDILNYYCIDKFWDSYDIKIKYLQF